MPLWAVVGLFLAVSSRTSWEYNFRFRWGRIISELSVRWDNSWQVSGPGFVTVGSFVSLLPVVKCFT